MKNQKLLFGLLLVLCTAALLGLTNSIAQEKTSLDYLPRVTGIAIHAKNPSQLLMASQQGLYKTTADKQAKMLARSDDEFTAFAVAPDDGNILYASGISSSKTNLGLLRSDDGGNTWVHISDGAEGGASFTALAISRADPKTIYGVYQGIQVSHDNGKSWIKAGDEPPGLISLAASSADPKRLYAATRGGLLISQDGGKNWVDGYQFNLPTTLVEVTEDGALYAYVLGRGLMRTTESTIEWELINNKFGSQVLLQMITIPGNKNLLYVLSNFGRVLVSEDGGKSWQRFSGDPQLSNEAEKRGAKLYAKNCQSCHGLEGVGETFTPEILHQKKYFFATPLNDLSHAWHHTDDQLVETIFTGSSRTKRMASWKGKLSELDARDIVAYIKSLWGQRALDCQGPKHMQCM